MPTCPVCGIAFNRELRRKAFHEVRRLRPRGECCSGRCYDKQWYKRTSKSASCRTCGNPCLSSRRNHSGKCSKCCHAETLAPFQLSGSDNPNWKGGHRNWAPGRHGRDSQGLSWKVQRRLVLERDSKKCQDTLCTTPWLRVCVHHRIPYRISLSHALDNLICLCERCHGRWEAVLHDPWGGQLVKRLRPKQQKPRCGVCNWPLKDGVCARCERRQNYSKWLEARKAGKSYPEIAKMFGLKSHSTVIAALQRHSLIAG